MAVFSVQVSAYCRWLQSTFPACAKASGGQALFIFHSSLFTAKAGLLPHFVRKRLGGELNKEGCKVSAIINNQ